MRNMIDVCVFVVAVVVVVVAVGCWLLVVKSHISVSCSLLL